MKSPAKPLSAFAIIFGVPRPQPHGGPTVLLVQRVSDKKYQLPGDELEPEEDIASCLMRCVPEQTGIHVETKRQIGPQHERPEAPNIVVAYECRPTGGGIRKANAGDEFKNARYFSLEEILTGKFMSCPQPGDLTLSKVQLIGPRTRRMVLDAMSIAQPPIVAQAPFKQLELAPLRAIDPVSVGTLFCIGERFYQYQTPDLVHHWPRLQMQEPV